MQEISRLLTFAPLNTILVQGRSIDPDAAAAAAAGFLAIGCIIWVILVIAFMIFPVLAFWKIFSKVLFKLKWMEIDKNNFKKVLYLIKTNIIKI